MPTVGDKSRGTRHIEPGDFLKEGILVVARQGLNEAVFMWPDGRLHVTKRVTSVHPVGCWLRYLLE